MALIDEEKQSVSNSLEDMVSAMRSLTWTPGTPLGTISEPHIVQDTRTYTRIGRPIYDEAAFNNFLLRDPFPRISSSYMKWLRTHLLDSHNIVMSHGDLNPYNIILQKDDNGAIMISGIIDWELGGWYPKYWDAVKAVNIMHPSDDSDWWCWLPPTLSGYTKELAINRMIEACTTSR